MMKKEELNNCEINNIMSNLPKPKFSYTKNLTSKEIFQELINDPIQKAFRLLSPLFLLLSIFYLVKIILKPDIMKGYHFFIFYVISAVLSFIFFIIYEKEFAKTIKKYPSLKVDFYDDFFLLSIAKQIHIYSYNDITSVINDKDFYYFNIKSYKLKIDKKTANEWFESHINNLSSKSIDTESSKKLWDSIDKNIKNYKFKHNINIDSSLLNQFLNLKKNYQLMITTFYQNLINISFMFFIIILPVLIIINFEGLAMLIWYALIIKSCISVNYVIKNKNMNEYIKIYSNNIQMYFFDKDIILKTNSKLLCVEYNDLAIQEIDNFICLKFKRTHTNLLYIKNPPLILLKKDEIDQKLNNLLNNSIEKLK